MLCINTLQTHTQHHYLVHSTILQFTGFPTSRLWTIRRTSVFLNLEHFTHRAPLCQPDKCDGCIQLESNRVDTNLLDTDSHSRGAEHNGCSWNVLKTSSVRCNASVSLRVAECKCSSWATLTNCFFLGGSVFLAWSFECFDKGTFCLLTKCFLHLYDVLFV